jgi:hypothetical protein
MSITSLSADQRHRYPLIGLALITLAVSSYGVFTLMTSVGVAALFALAAVAVLDLSAVGFGYQAVRTTEAGDSALWWYVAMVFFMFVATSVQIGHGVLAGWPWPAYAVFALAPVATVTLFIGNLRSRARAKARLDGKAPRSQATFEPRLWFFESKLTWTAFRKTLLDRDLDSESALAVAYEELNPGRTFRVLEKDQQAHLNFAGRNAIVSEERPAIEATETRVDVEAPKGSTSSPGPSPVATTGFNTDPWLRVAVSAVVSQMQEEQIKPTPKVVAERVSKDLGRQVRSDSVGKILRKMPELVSA